MQLLKLTKMQKVPLASLQFHCAAPPSVYNRCKWNSPYPTHTKTPAKKQCQINIVPGDNSIQTAIELQLILGDTGLTAWALTKRPFLLFSLVCWPKLSSSSWWTCKYDLATKKTHQCYFFFSLKNNHVLRALWFIPPGRPSPSRVYSL